MSSQVKCKLDLAHWIDEAKPVRIDLGCGHKKRSGHIGIDRLDMDCVDIVGDLDAALKQFPDNSVDSIYSKSVLEHVENLEEVMRQIMRVLKPGAEVYIFVPHWSSPYYYQDYTHIRFFGLYTFYQFSDEKNQHPARAVPCFYQDINIRIKSIKMVFKSNFRIIRPLRKLLTFLVNLSPWFQAIWEENGTYLVPCYGLEIVFTANK